MGTALLLLATAMTWAQENGEEIISALKDRAIVLDIVARVVERDKEEIWNSVSKRVTIPGRAVSLKLVGSNVIVSAQFTPYTREDGKQVLVAQGQVWTTSKEEGMRYHTTMQTIPLDFGERVYFFPLGPLKSDGRARIEIQLELRPYRAEAAPETGPAEKKDTASE
ncbi:MAG TPA: hypothetical protein DIC34_17480 [Treponema sp.]|nr:hypothetical protein [Treponema sp.]